MGIHIRQINVEKAGPVSGLQLPLSRFNLVYGLNEQGKTFLVEFVTRSLFRNLAGWHFRSGDSRGKVVVEGFGNGARTFMPTSRSKLEDLLAERESGLPPRISRLLVVKGADLTFDGQPGSGIDVSILKEFLSGHSVLDDVQRKISKTIQKAGISRGEIVGPKMGELSARNGLISELRAYDNLFARLDADFSRSASRRLQEKADVLALEIAAQEEARRHSAYKLNHQALQKRQELERLPETELEALRSDLLKLQDAQDRAKRLQLRLEEMAGQSEHYVWLDEAIAQYEARNVDVVVKEASLYPALALLALTLAVVAGLIGFPAGTLIMAGATALLGWLTIRRYREAMDRVHDTEETRRLAVEFQSKFGVPLSGLPQMKEKKRAMEEAYHGLRTTRDELQNEQENIASTQSRLDVRLQALVGESLDPTEWHRRIPALLQLRERLQREVSRLQVDLAELAVPAEEFRSEPAAVEYQPAHLRTLVAELDETNARLADIAAGLNNLKQQISAHTGDAISNSWEQIIRNLQLKREEKSREYRHATAMILAKILVNEQLNTIRTQEQQAIRKRLETPEVCRPIAQITRRYSGVRYQDDTVFVTDDFGRFALGDLSTGAREQVLLGLRLGFAAQVLRHTHLFLLLDDAFQHADWQRRQWLLEQVVALAREGWQIIYFTMDEHIRDIFESAGRRYFADSYTFHELRG